MSFDPEIDNLRERLAKAESDRDHWRASGRQEKYLESYFLVEALELQLDRLRRQRVESSAQHALGAKQR